jgi:hypothetical protein
MRFTFNTKEQIKTKLEEQLAETTNKLEAWKKVEVKRKKDGSEFAQLGRAISGGRIEEDSGYIYAHPKLYVSYSENGVYGNDYICLYGFVDELPLDDERREGYTPGFERPTYVFSMQAVRDKITQYIKQYAEQVEKLKKQLEISDRAFDLFRTKVKEAYDELIEFDNEVKSSDNKFHSSLFYLLTETN